MKIKLIIAFVSLIISSSAFSQEMKTDTFTVYGNCGMCKETIEGALKKRDGISSKKWSVKEKILTVTYDPAKITVQQIGQKVAQAGYDNVYAIAPDEKYNKLHSCCQYVRMDKK